MRVGDAKVGEVLIGEYWARYLRDTFAVATDPGRILVLWRRYPADVYKEGDVLTLFREEVSRVNAGTRFKVCNGMVVSSLEGEQPWP